MRRVSSFALFVLGAAGPLAAQNPQCQRFAGSTQTVNLCNAVIDGTEAFHPVVGLLTSGGAPVLGTNSLGGLGHLYLSVRVNASHVVLPDLNFNGSTTTVGAGTSIFFPSPVVEAAVGIFGGTRAGLFGFDLLGSAQLLPTDQVDNLSVDPSAHRIGSLALGLGIGARVGILRESALTPGVAVSVMRRSVPQIRYGDLATGAQFTFAADLTATNLRATASKRLALLNVGGGLGWDRYTGDAEVQFRNPSTSLPETIDLSLSHSRTMGFVNAGLDFRHVKLMAEAGYQLGKDQHLATTFTDFDPSGGRFFAAAGLTFGL